ncbi:MAG: M20/M25/M40 family metallo-hydrolase [Candidatus Lokiarchaeota archaeon]|nr:M20/M25/M40 family metallo-hydrolase [Candidatus Lokiarchaeota archaeon]
MVEFVKEEDARYAHEFIKAVCTEIGPGSPCSPQERQRAMRAKEEMEKTADSVHVEDFKCAPGAYVGWFKLGALCAVVAEVFFYLSLNSPHAILHSAIAFGLSVFIFLILIFEFILPYEFVDFLFPKRTSCNVVGRIGAPPGGGQPKRIIIFSGHHDSALQFRWLQYLKWGYYVAEACLMLGVVMLAALLAIHLFALLAGAPADWAVSFNITLSYTLLPVVVFFAVFFAESGKNGGKVPGASDNLAAVAIVLAIGRILKRHPELVPAGTEIRLVSFGCEEAGERGSTAFAKRHLAELRSADANVLNFESICRPHMSIFTSDRNGTLRNDPGFVATIADAARAAGVPHTVRPFYFGGGGTDALPFSAMGIKATSLFSMKVPHQMIEFYHQTHDNYDKVPVEALYNALKVAVAFLLGYG